MPESVGGTPQDARLPALNRVVGADESALVSFSSIPINLVNRYVSFGSRRFYILQAV
jgi:hypothetical protein